MVYVIVRDRERDRAKLKGKTVVEFSRNLESEGWPTEFASEGDRDRLAFEEKKRGRAMRKQDVRVDHRPPAVKALHKKYAKEMKENTERIRSRRTK